MKKRIKKIFEFQEPAVNPLPRAIGAGVTIFIARALGIYLNSPLLGGMMTLGSMTFMYFQHISSMRLLRRLAIIGSCMILTNFVGLLLAHNIHYQPIVLMVTAFLCRICFLGHRIPLPGAVFFVVVSTASARLKLPLNHIGIAVFYFSLGVTLAIIAALVINNFLKSPHVATVTFKEVQSELKNRSYLWVNAIFYALSLGFASWISLKINLFNSYWMLITVASFLQQDTFELIIHKNYQRVIGTAVGCLIAALALHIHLPVYTIIVLIGLFYFLGNYFVSRNYAIGMSFITPMSLMQASLSHYTKNQTLIQFRFFDVILGGLLALLVAWLFSYIFMQYHNLAIRLPQKFSEIDNPYDRILTSYHRFRNKNNKKH